MVVAGTAIRNGRTSVSSKPNEETNANPGVITVNLIKSTNIGDVNQNPMIVEIMATRV